MSRTEKATETRMKAKDLRIAERLKARGWQVSAPMVPSPALVVTCPPHGPHPHGGLTCLDCEVCRPPHPCAGGRCPDPEAHAEGGHDV